MQGGSSNGEPEALEFRVDPQLLQNQAETGTTPAQDTLSRDEAPKSSKIHQACIPCHRRKVWCELGSTQDPPCQRCRRESMECTMFDSEGKEILCLAGSARTGLATPKLPPVPRWLHQPPPSPGLFPQTGVQASELASNLGIQGPRDDATRRTMSMPPGFQAPTTHLSHQDPADGSEAQFSFMKSAPNDHELRIDSGTMIDGSYRIAREPLPSEPPLPKFAYEIWDLYSKSSALSPQPPSPSRSQPEGTQDSLSALLRETGASEPTGIEHRVDSKLMSDSGYPSNPRNSYIDFGDWSVFEIDTGSVVTDGWPSSLPMQDEHMLETAFAGELFNRSSAQTREQFVEQGETVMDLLYSFSVMIEARANSVAERSAASLVRLGRKYVSSGGKSKTISDTRANSIVAYWSMYAKS